MLLYLCSNNFNTLSRDAVSRRVASSWVVAMAVTQPPWPLSTPLSLSCSPILICEREKLRYKLNKNYDLGTKELELT